MPSIQETLNAYLDKKDASEVLSILQALHQIHELNDQKPWISPTLHLRNNTRKTKKEIREENAKDKENISELYDNYKGDMAQRDKIADLMRHLIDNSDCLEWYDQFKYTGERDTEDRELSPIVQTLLDVGEQKYQDELNEKENTIVKKQVEIGKTGAPILDSYNCFGDTRRYYLNIAEYVDYDRSVSLEFDTKKNKVFADISYPSYSLTGDIDQIDVSEYKIVSSKDVEAHNKKIGLHKVQKELKKEVDKVKEALEKVKQGKNALFSIHEEGVVSAMLQDEISLLEELEKKIDALKDTKSESIDAIGIEIDGKNYSKKALLKRSEAIANAYSKNSWRDNFTLKRKIVAINTDISKVVNALREQSVTKISIRNLKEEINKQLKTQTGWSPYLAAVTDILATGEDNANVTLVDLEKHVKAEGFKVYDTLSKSYLASFYNSVKTAVDGSLKKDIVANLLHKLHMCRDDDETVQQYIDDFRAAFVSHFSRQPTQIPYPGIQQIMGLVDDNKDDIREFMRVDHHPDNNSDANMTLDALKKRFIMLPLALQNAIADAVGDTGDYALASSRMGQLSQLVARGQGPDLTNPTIEPSKREEDFKENYVDRADKLVLLSTTAIEMAGHARPGLGMSKEELEVIKDNFGNLAEDLKKLCNHNYIDITDVMAQGYLDRALGSNPLLNQTVGRGDNAVVISEKLLEAVEHQMKLRRPGLVKRRGRDESEYAKEFLNSSNRLLQGINDSILHLDRLIESSTTEKERDEYINQLSRKDAELRPKMAAKTLLRAENLNVAAIEDIEPLINYAETAVKEGLGNSLNSINKALDKKRKVRADLAKQWKQIRDGSTISDQLKSPIWNFTSKHITGPWVNDDKLLEILNDVVKNPESNDGIDTDEEVYADEIVENIAGSTDAKLIQFLQNQRNILALEARKQEILKFQGEQYVDYFKAPLVKLRGAGTEMMKVGKQVKRYLKGGSFEDRPVDLDVKQIINMIRDTGTGTFEQLEEIVSNLKSISELAEYQRVGILDNDTGLDFVEPFAVIKDSTQLTATMQQIAQRIGQRRIDEYGVAPTETPEEIGLDRIAKPALASDPIERKLIDEYNALESVKLNSAQLHRVHEKFKELVTKHKNSLREGFEVVKSERNEDIRKKLLQYIHLTNHSLYDQKKHKDQLDKLKRELTEVANKRTDDSKEKLLNMISDIDNSAELIQISYNNVSEIYTESIKQNNQIDGEISQSLMSYLQDKLTDDLRAVAVWPFRERDEAQKLYTKICASMPLPISRGKGLQDLKDALLVMRSNADRTGVIIDNAQKQFSRQLQAINVQVRQLVATGKSAEAMEKIEDLRKTILEYKEAWMGKKDTLNRLEHFFSDNLDKPISELEEKYAKAEKIKEKLPRQAADDLRKAVAAFDDDRVKELYEKHGGNKDAMKRALFGNTIDREWWSLDQSWWPFGKNRTAFGHLEKKIDAQYAVTEFKLADKFYTRTGRAAAGAGLQDKADFKVQGPKDKLRKEFLENIDQSREVFLKSYHDYYFGPIQNESEQIKEMLGLIKDINMLDNKRSKLSEFLNKEKPKDGDLKIQDTIDGCVQLDQVLKDKPYLPAEQLYSYIANTEDYAALRRLLSISESGIIPSNPRIRQYHELRAQAEDMQRLYDEMVSAGYNDNTPEMEKLKEAIHGTDEIPGILSNNVPRTEDLFESVTGKHFSHNVLERYMLEVDDLATEDERDKQANMFEDAETKEKARFQELLAEIGLDENLEIIRNNEVEDIEDEMAEILQRYKDDIPGADDLSEGDIKQFLLQSTDENFVNYRILNDKLEVMRAKSNDANPTLISVLKQTIAVLEDEMPYYNNTDTDYKNLEDLKRQLEEYVTNISFIGEEKDIKDLAIKKIMSKADIPGYTIVDQSDLVKQILKCKKALKDYREARVKWEKSKGEFKKHEKKAATVYQQADKREELEAQLDNVVKAQLDALLTDDIETFMKYGGASGFNQMATDIADTKSGFKKLSTIDRIMNKVRKTSKKKVGAAYLRAQLKARFDKITTDDPNYMNRVNAYDMLPSDLRDQLSKNENEKLRKAFAETARGLVAHTRTPTWEVIETEVLKFVMSTLKENPRLRAYLSDEIKQYVSHRFDKKKTPTPVLAACLTAIISKKEADIASYEKVLGKVSEKRAIEGNPVTVGDITNMSVDEIAQYVAEFPALEAVKNRISMATAIESMQTQLPAQGVGSIQECFELLERVNRTALHYHEVKEQKITDFLTNKEMSVIPEVVNPELFKTESLGAAENLQDDLIAVFGQKPLMVEKDKIFELLQSNGFQIEPKDIELFGENIDVSPLVCGQSLKDFIDAENGKVLEGTIDENTSAVAAKKILGNKLDEFIDKFEIDDEKADAMHAHLQGLASYKNRSDLETALYNALVPSKPLLGRLAGATTKSFERARAIEGVECALKGEPLTAVHEKFLHLKTLIEQRGGEPEKITEYTDRLEGIENELPEGLDVKNALDTAIKNFNNRGLDGKRTSRQVNLNNLEASFNEIKNGPTQSPTNG